MRTVSVRSSHGSRCLLWSFKAPHFSLLSWIARASVPKYNGQAAYSSLKCCLAGTVPSYRALRHSHDRMRPSRSDIPQRWPSRLLKISSSGAYAISSESSLFVRFCQAIPGLASPLAPSVRKQARCVQRLPVAKADCLAMCTTSQISPSVQLAPSHNYIGDCLNRSPNTNKSPSSRKQQIA